MNPFISVFTDTADFTDVDNQLSTDMVSVPREEWEWTMKYIAFLSFYQSTGTPRYGEGG